MVISSSIIIEGTLKSDYFGTMSFSDWSNDVSYALYFAAVNSGLAIALRSLYERDADVVVRVTGAFDSCEEAAIDCDGERQGLRYTVAIRVSKVEIIGVSGEYEELKG